MVVPPSSPIIVQPKEPKAKKAKVPKEPKEPKAKKPKEPKKGKESKLSKADKAPTSREFIESDADDDASDPLLSGPSTKSLVASTSSRTPKAKKKSASRAIFDSDEDEYNERPAVRTSPRRGAIEQTRSGSPQSPSHPTILQQPSSTGKRKADTDGSTPRSTKSRKKASDDSPGCVAAKDDIAPPLSDARDALAGGGNDPTSDVEMADSVQKTKRVVVVELVKPKKGRKPKGKEKENALDDTTQAPSKVKRGKKKAEIQLAAPISEQEQEADEVRNDIFR